MYHWETAPPLKADKSRTANYLDRRVEIHQYQAETAALAEQLNEQIVRTRQRKNKNIQSTHIANIDHPHELTASHAATDTVEPPAFKVKQNEALILTSTAVQF